METSQTNKWLNIGITPPAILARIKAEQAAKARMDYRLAARKRSTTFDYLAFFIQIEELFKQEEGWFVVNDIVDFFGNSNSRWRSVFAEWPELFELEMRTNPAARGASGKVVYRKLKHNWKELYHERL